MTDDQFDQHGDEDLRERLRSIDPAASLPPADPAWLARLLEDTMSSDTDTDSESTESRASGTRDRSPLTWLVAAAAVVLIAGVGIFGFLNRGADVPDVPTAQDTPTRTDAPSEPSGTDDPTVTVLSVPSALPGRCMVPNADTLSRSPLAFDGTVEDVADGTVTLNSTTFYAGEQTDLVTVESSPEALAALIGAVEFEVGQRYLVSASDGQVTVCGLSGPFSPELENLYREAFPS